MENLQLDCEKLFVYVVLRQIALLEVNICQYPQSKWWWRWLQRLHFTLCHKAVVPKLF